MCTKPMKLTHTDEPVYVSTFFFSETTPRMRIKIGVECLKVIGRI
jgi:hypothetical protein